MGQALTSPSNKQKLNDLEVHIQKIAQSNGISVDAVKYLTKVYNVKRGWEWDEARFAHDMKIHPVVADAMFSLFDVDGDKHLDIDEFIQGYGHLVAGTNTDRLALLFMIFDRDGSGDLDKAEVKAMLRACIKSFHDAAIASGGPGGASVSKQAIMLQAKKSVDGRDVETIEAEIEQQVVISTKQLFDVCDENHDGNISHEEFKRCLGNTSCEQINKILNLFYGGSISMWNSLGLYIEVNGALPKEGDYKVETPNSKEAKSKTKRGNSMNPPGCSQQ